MMSNKMGDTPCAHHRFARLKLARNGRHPKRDTSAPGPSHSTSYRKKSCDVKGASGARRERSSRKGQNRIFFATRLRRGLQRAALWCAGLLTLWVALGLGSPRATGAESLATVASAGPDPFASVRARGREVAMLASAVRLRDTDPEGAATMLSGLFVEAESPDVLSRTAELLVSDASSEWPRGDRRAFLVDLAPAALLSAREVGLPPSVTLAQAIIESGWGRSRLARDYNNLFGVKASRGERGVSTTTREGRGWSSARFRAYSDWSESLAHHQELLSESSRYASARAHAHSWRPFLAHLAPIYATSRTYTREVGGLIERYDLDRWDALVREAAERQAAAQDVAAAPDAPARAG